MENKIPTAEEFLKKHDWTKDYPEMLREFAKLHLQAQAEAIYNNQQIEQYRKEEIYSYPDSSHFRATKNSITNAYSLENVK